MNATERWANEFVKALECVKCRTKNNLTLYGYDKKPVDTAAHTLDHLKSRIPRMDVWCKDCVPKINTRVQGKPRQQHKNEAAEIADLRVSINPSSVLDTYIVGHYNIPRPDILKAVKNRPCAVCGNKYPAGAMDFHHVDSDSKLANVGSMVAFSGWTMGEIIKEIEKCVVVCATCHRLVTYGFVDEPKETVKLDEFFWEHFEEYVAEQDANPPKIPYETKRAYKKKVGLIS